MTPEDRLRAEKIAQNAEAASLTPLRSISAQELLYTEFPPRETVLAPWLPQKGLAMIYGPRGIGKTHLTLGIAYAIACGSRFLRWHASQAFRVVILDGEMPGVTLQSRLAEIVTRNGGVMPSPDYLRLIALDLQDRSLDLSNQAHLFDLEQYLEGVDVIIVDNISTLCQGGRENEAESWLLIQQWMLSQRRRNRSVVFIHHAGKGGAQRGTSRREDVLDSVLALRQPDDYDSEQGARFALHYEKSRGFYGEDAKPFEARLMHDGWTTRDLEDADMARIVKLSEDGLNVREIANELGGGWSKSRVSRYQQKAREQRLTGAAGHA